MSSSPVSLPVPAQPYGRPPLRTVQVLGGAGAGSCAHVRSLATGLAARGVRVTVCAPVAAEGEYDFTGAGAQFTPDAVSALRAACAGADVVHAHGLRAGMRAALALRGGGRRVPLVVTWHGGAPEPAGALGRLSRLLERRVARAAAVVLGASSDQVDLARRRGARDARLAAPAVPVATAGEPAAEAGKTRAELGAVERPLVIAVGSLVARRGYALLLDAARAWRVLDPLPLLVIAGEGPLRSELARRIEAEGLPVRLLGRRRDADRLLAAADVAVLPSRWEGRSLLAQEALRAGVALVATEVGGVPELVGDAAVLVPYGDPGALAGAVAGLLHDPDRRAALALAGRAQAATWPSEDETVAQVLSVYDELMERHRP
ncbi:glycosyltransferase family 4 protein [Streptomyces lavendulae]|uniref:D-inositol 3-phosphate glycosyltransferase n=1 Tax=Streptomyces lavendulae subsp. lavendulae TaxID=58340 RepID=A0A2K8PL84_STRLA|nr:glycosyltransferase family 4 protein [Streptomyces lavendulae]ATZ27496.1 Alpha-D-kanosaminyltransferase [Streptomyces lavendulae subsp. lavendulae]QUQ57323.1 D-inositol-3-phosphate glycosyltransferase [Streptomyces lavendulae subsp. lavendulae]